MAVRPAEGRGGERPAPVGGGAWPRDRKRSDGPVPMRGHRDKAPLKVSCGALVGTEPGRQILGRGAGGASPGAHGSKFLANMGP